LHSDAFSNGFYVVEKDGIDSEVHDGDSHDSDSEFISSSDELAGRAIIKNVGEVGGLFLPLSVDLAQHHLAYRSNHLGQPISRLYQHLTVRHSK
jgi:hypothetical protein